MAKIRRSTPRSADSVLGVPSLELVLGCLDRLPGTHAAAVSYFCRTGQYEAASSVRVDPSCFERHDEFALALLGISLIRKYPGLPGAEDKASPAIEKWRACEETCRETNERFKQFRIGQVRPDLHEAFRLARSKIQRLLGPFRWSKPAKYFNFGPGSTTRLPFSKRHLPYKYGEAPETTFDNLASAVAVIGLSPTWVKSSGGRITDGIQPCVKIREESKVTTVPKDAFIDRVIAIEPDMNMFVQKGFGGYIRKVLKRVGVDLDDQVTNQLLARHGSMGSLATIDLSSASDTIAFELVRELLPNDWFEALLSCRTHASRLPSGEVLTLQKFSAMGNGYTFELESLIFWALCSSVCQETVGREGLRASVYGDDIIVTVGDFPAVVDILGFSGFTLNPKKTFADGPYRESCGKHYFYGRDVTPVTITKEITHVSQLLLLSNNLTRWALRAGDSLYRDSSVLEAYRFCVGNLPSHFRRPKLPDGYGDGALIGSFDETTPQRCSRGWDGWRVSGVLLSKPRTRQSAGVAVLSACLSELERHGQHPLHPFSRGVYNHVFQRGARGLHDRVRESFGSGRGRFHTDNVGYSLECESRRKSDGFVADVVREWSGQELSQVSLVPYGTRDKLGKIFVRQWCDIGPWV